MPDITRGEIIPLNFAQDNPAQRIFVGLGWDPNIETSLKAKMASMLGGSQTNHDLDLSCYLLDTQGALLQTICAKAGQMVNQSGHIYHSGDDTDGLGLGDDEQISVELAHLSTQIAHIVFVASISSGHVFDEIDTPEMRIVDGYTKRIISRKELGTQGSHYVFLKIYRDDEDIWNIQFIDEYRETAISPESLKSYQSVTTP